MRPTHIGKGTSSTLTVNGLLASTNGVSGRFGKYNEISSASMCKCSFTEIIIVIVQCHVPQRKQIRTCELFLSGGTPYENGIDVDPSASRRGTAFTTFLPFLRAQAHRRHQRRQ
uniref:Uncharacterized protein n=1 Tax=Molossus molossus TaxID=27622 RepID=A0A7J8GM49_MOLMO|nr:hypothetical protein HJG59_011511 [Molossus molossus]